MKLNFIKINIPNSQTFRIYRKLGSNKEEGQKVFLLKNTTGQYVNFNVSLNEIEGFEEYNVPYQENNSLTKYIILKCILKEIEQSNHDVLPPKNHFEERVATLILSQKSKGKEVIELIPYYLKEKNAFGILVNFSFKKNADVQFDLEVQKLSLSCDSRGRSNANFYNDYYEKINSIFQIIRNISFNNNILQFEESFEILPTRQLAKKTYDFGNQNFHNSQFQGISKHSPYKAIEIAPKIVFLFTEDLRLFSREVYLGLLGRSHTSTFSGMEKIFKLPFSSDNVDHVIIKDTSVEQLDEAVSKIIDKHGTSNLIVIYSQSTREEEPYYYLKMKFLEKNIALQVITQDIVGSQNSLKWSLSNIGLQIFAKLGGVPWLVKPTLNNCLIIGIGQSHKRDENGLITKFFSYSVCLGSDGRYDRLEILGESNTEESYLQKLKENLVNLLGTTEYKDYQNIVLHVPYKIRNEEMIRIDEAINSVSSNTKFSIVRINERNNYMGFSEHKTRVPYESSLMKLSNNEFLVWFEGMQYGKELVYKRTAKPIYIDVRKKPDEVSVNDLLQDIINLSGANWRGFNAKKLPISIYYAQLISEYSKHFQSFKDFKESIFSDSKPWFL